MDKQTVITKAGLVDIIRETTGFTKDDATKALDHTLNAIAESVTSGKTVSVMRFGKFTPTLRKEKVVRDIKKGTSFILPAKKVVKFKPSNQMAQDLDDWDSNK